MVGGSRVGVGLGVVLPVPSVVGDTATFVEVLPGVDVVARVSVESVSTFVVVKSREAGRNPLVRRLGFGVSGGGARVVDGGGVVVRDGGGVDRVAVSAAVMWDSTGGSVGAVSGERVVPSALARGRQMRVEAAGSRVSVIPDAEFLDDPATVYPVVIDPTLSEYGADYFKRFVSNDCFYYSSDTLDGLYTGNKARVGYDGWDKSASSCYSYYESELFYRFTWPESMDGDFIRSAKFVHVNSYSTQHAPCDELHNGSPIDVGITDAFDEGADSWAERPAFLVDPTDFVSNDYAAGLSPTYCSVSSDVVWDLTDQFASVFEGQVAEDVYVAMIAHDDRDRDTWRHFDNVWGAGAGSRPLLIVEYVPVPEAPVSVSVAAGDVLGVSGLLSTRMSTPVLRAVLPGTVSCPSSSACYLVRFEVLWRDPNKSSPVPLFVVDFEVGAAGSVVSAQVPVGKALVGDRTYVVRARSVNTAYPDLAVSASVSLSPELRLSTSASPPGGPTWTAASLIVAPSGSWSVHAMTSSGSVTRFCLADGEAAGPGTRCVATSGWSADLSSAGLVAAQSPYSFRVWVCYATGECVASKTAATVWVA